MRTVLLRPPGCLLLAALAFISPARAQEGGIETFAGETLFDQGTRVSISHIYKLEANVYRGSSHVRDPLDRRRDEHRTVVSVDHGVLPDLTVSLLIPVVYKEHRERPPGGGSSRRQRSFGLGDLALIGKYRVYRRDWPRSALNVAVIGGLEMPTGATDERDDGARLAPSMQPGIGAWNPFAAASATLSIDRFRFDANVFYKLNTRGAQQFRAGGFFATEVDVAYRFLFTTYPGPTASARLGLQWRQEARDHQDGGTIDSSGGTELVLRPGLTWHPIPRMDVSLTVDVPVYRHLRGEQLGRDLRVFGGLGVRF